PAGAGGDPRVHHLGGDPARPGAARVRAAPGAPGGATDRPARPAPGAGRQPGGGLAGAPGLAGPEPADHVLGPVAARAGCAGRARSRLDGGDVGAGADDLEGLAVDPAHRAAVLERVDHARAAVGVLAPGRFQALDHAVFVPRLVAGIEDPGHAMASVEPMATR